jgi:hypothetical protein
MSELAIRMDEAQARYCIVCDGQTSFYRTAWRARARLVLLRAMGRVAYLMER